MINIIEARLMSLPPLLSITPHEPMRAPQLCGPYAVLLTLLLWLFSSQVGAVVVLQYHHVDDDTPPSTSISPALFEEHLDYIEQNDFVVWALDKAVDHIKNQRALPDRVVTITFDDAYSSIYEHAFPLLKEKNYPFTVFVATQPIEQGLSSFMTWAQLKEMMAYGATIANHTHTHAHLVRQRDGESKTAWLSRVESDLNTAQTLIKQNLGRAPMLLAYPYGEHNDDVEQLVADLGYVAFGQQSGAMGTNMSMTALPRFPMTNVFGAMKQFRLKVASLPYPAVSMEPSLRILRDQNIDQLSITFEHSRPRTACFFGGKPLDIDQRDSTVVINDLPKLPVGRSRINCTAPSNERDRFYWYSYTWIKPNPDGSWYPE